MEEKERREKQVTKRAVVQVIIISLIGMIISFIAVQYLLVYVSQRQVDIFGDNETEKLLLKIMLFVDLVLYIVMGSCLLNISIAEAKRKLYKEMSQELLSEDTYLEVHPQESEKNIT